MYSRPAYASVGGSFCWSRCLVLCPIHLLGVKRFLYAGVWLLASDARVVSGTAKFQDVLIANDRVSFICDKDQGGCHTWRKFFFLASNASVTRKCCSSQAFSVRIPRHPFSWATWYATCTPARICTPKDFLSAWRRKWRRQLLFGEELILHAQFIIQNVSVSMKGRVCETILRALVRGHVFVTCSRFGQGSAHRRATVDVPLPQFVKADVEIVEKVF